MFRETLAISVRARGPARPRVSRNGVLTPARKRQIRYSSSNSLMQGFRFGVLVLGAMEVLTATTDRVVLLVLMGISCTSVLAILIQQIAIIVRTASL